MTKLDFAERLRRAMDSGSLTVSDLSRWFGRPYTTVHKWLTYNREPWGPNGQHALDQLSDLEERIKLKRGFPIPVSLSPAARIRHMEGLKRVNRIPAAHSAK